MHASSLTDAYAPVAAHLERLGVTSSAVRPVDAYLLGQIASLQARPPLVVDLAAPSTQGASAAVWAIHRETIRALWIQCADGTGPGAWARHLTATMTAAGPAAPDVTWLGGRGDDTGLRRRLAAGEAGDGALFFVAPADQVDEALAGLAMCCDAAVFVLGVGRIGASGALEKLLSIAGIRSPYCLTCPRELHPVLADSELGLVHRRADAVMPEVLERIAASFAGNFDFLRMATAHVELLQRVADCTRVNTTQRAEILELRERLAREQASLAPAILRRLYRATIPRSWRARLYRIRQGHS